MSETFAAVAAAWIGSLGFLSFRGGLEGVAQLAGASFVQWAAVDFLNRSRAKGTKAFVVHFGFTPPIWQSTDDNYWRDVLNFFNLRNNPGTRR
jgi:hypothetical protein